MTMTEVKSIEDKLVKISLRSLLILIGFFVSSVWIAAVLYGNLMRSQDQIISEIKRSRDEFNYKLDDVNKDVLNIDKRVTKNEITIDRIRSYSRGE